MTHNALICEKQRNTVYVSFPTVSFPHKNNLFGILPPFLTSTCSLTHIHTIPHHFTRVPILNPAIKNRTLSNCLQAHNILNIQAHNNTQTQKFCNPVNKALLIPIIIQLNSREIAGFICCSNTKGISADISD